MNNIKLEVGLTTLAQKIMDDHPDTFVHFISLCAARVMDDTELANRRGDRLARYVGRMKHAFDKDGELFVRVLAGLQGEK